MSLVAIMGTPGSGKTTIASLLSTLYPFAHVSAGDVARRLAETDAETAAALEDGKLAPRQKMNDAMLDYLLGAGNYIIDGYPRYFEQLTDTLLFHPEALFIVLTLEQESAMQRLRERARGDDNLSAIRHRINTFNHETQPVISWLKRRRPNNVAVIDASAPVRRVLDMAADTMDRWFGVQYSNPGDRDDG